MNYMCLSFFITIGKMEKVKKKQKTSTFKKDAGKQSDALKLLKL